MLKLEESILKIIELREIGYKKKEIAQFLRITQSMVLVYEGSAKDLLRVERFKDRGDISYSTLERISLHYGLRIELPEGLRLTQAYYEKAISIALSEGIDSIEGICKRTKVPIEIVRRYFFEKGLTPPEDPKKGIPSPEKEKFKPPISKIDVHTLKELITNGTSQTDIARYFKCSRQAVSEYLKTHRLYNEWRRNKSFHST